MPAAPRPFVVLIRAIGPATHRRIPLASLCRDCESAGFSEVRNYLATGNIILRGSGSPSAIARQVGSLISRYGLGNRAFVRRPIELRRALAADPFPDASRDRPSRMLVTFFDEPLDEGAVGALASGAGPERVRGIGRELYVDYAEGVGQSRVTPALIERTLGQAGTARNWNTLRGILDRV